MSDYIDETHQRISEFAAEFLDDDDERESFVDGLMERRGYQRGTHWTAPEPEQGQGRQPLVKPKGGQRQQGGQQPQQRTSYFGGAKR